MARSFPVPVLSGWRARRLVGTVYQDRAGRWRWRLRGRNGEIVSVSQSYTRRDSALRGLRRVAPDAR